MDNCYRCFADDFYELCEKNGNKIMMIYTVGTEKKSYSCKEVFCLTRRYITFFNQKGMMEGDTIVSIMPNSPEAIICFFASALSGIHYAPVPCAVSNREFTNWINLVKPKIIIRKEGVADYEAMIPIHNCECDGSFSWLPMETCTYGRKTTSNIYLMTSGTTGTPKAMSINIDRLWSSGIAFADYYGIRDSGYRFWNYLPMSYLGGLYNLALIPLCINGSFVVSEPFSGKTILNFWNYVNSNGITALWMVPSIVQGLLRIVKLTGRKNVCQFSDKIKIAFLGTAPVRLKTKEEFEEIFGIRLYENFALSESTFLTAENEGDIRFREQGSVGKLLPYISLKLAPVEGSDQVKCIWIKSPYLFNGYLSENGMEKLELDDEGFFDTKDLGYLNEDDIVVLSGRSRDIIKKGGLFVSLIEIENTVKQLPFIEDVVAVPIKHDFYGEAYTLYVLLKEELEAEKQKEELHLWMLENFVHYKMPETIYIYKGEFPKTASGKIQKNKIAEKMEELSK